MSSELMYQSGPTFYRRDDPKIKSLNVSPGTINICTKEY